MIVNLEYTTFIQKQRSGRKLFILKVKDFYPFCKLIGNRPQTYKADMTFSIEIQKMNLGSLFSSRTFSAVKLLLVISSADIKTVGIHGNVC